MSSFRALAEVIRERGLFCSLYADRASHYWHTPDAGGKVDKDNPTQVGRALQRLGIELIEPIRQRPGGGPSACSAPCRSACRRNSGRRHHRDEANRFLKEVYLARFAIRPRRRARRILCIHEERTVANDNTVRYKRLALQIPADRHRLRQGHGPGARVSRRHARRLPGPRCLRYKAGGEPIEGRPRDPLRRDRPKPCGQVDSRSAPDHLSTGPTTATEAVNSSGT